MTKIEELSTLPMTGQIFSDSPQSSSLNSNSSKLSKKLEEKKMKRPSASKKYSGQIMVGVARFALTLLENSSDPIDKSLIDFIIKNSLGKQKEDYKFNSVDKIRNFFLITAKDNLLTQQIKLKFSILVKMFFEKRNFENWVLKEFKGAQENKDWYLINHQPLYDRIMLNKKTHFYIDGKLNPFLMDNLTISDNKTDDKIAHNIENFNILKEEEGDLKKKVKTEEVSIYHEDNINLKGQKNLNEDSKKFLSS